MGIEHTRRRRKTPPKNLRFEGRGKFRGARQMRLVAREHETGVVTRQAHPSELAALEATLAARRAASPLDKSPPSLPTKTAERLVRQAETASG